MALLLLSLVLVLVSGCCKVFSWVDLWGPLWLLLLVPVRCVSVHGVFKSGPGLLLLLVQLVVHGCGASWLGVLFSRYLCGRGDREHNWDFFAFRIPIETLVLARFLL